MVKICLDKQDKKEYPNGARFVVGGVAEKLGILAVAMPDTVGPLFGLVGFAIPVGIGLYEDYKEGKVANATTVKPQ